MLAEDDDGPTMWLSMAESGDWPAPVSDPDRAASELDIAVSDPDRSATAAAATGDTTDRGAADPELFTIVERERFVYRKESRC